MNSLRSALPPLLSADSLDLYGKAEPLAQLVNCFFDLRSIWHFTFAIQHLRKQLERTLHGRLGHVIGDIDRTVSIQPSRTNHLDLVAEIHVVVFVETVSTLLRDDTN